MNFNETLFLFQDSNSVLSLPSPTSPPLFVLPITIIDDEMDDTSPISENEQELLSRLYLLLRLISLLRPMSTDVVVPTSEISPLTTESPLSVSPKPTSSTSMSHGVDEPEILD